MSKKNFQRVKCEISYPRQHVTESHEIEVHLKQLGTDSLLSWHINENYENKSNL